MSKKRSWFWNVLIILTVVACIAAFVLHYKNYVDTENEVLSVRSGIYSEQISIDSIREVIMVAKLPKMERNNGFSWLAREKGIFKDSLTQAEVYVFVDDLRQHKIKVVYHDSLQMFINLADSLQTQALFEQLKTRITNGNE